MKISYYQNKRSLKNNPKWSHDKSGLKTLSFNLVSKQKPTNLIFCYNLYCSF